MNQQNQLEIVDKCLAQLGKATFFDAFLDLAKSCGAVQISILSCNTEKPRCLLSRNFDQTPAGELTTSIYLSGWYQHDPLLKEVRTLKSGALEVRHLKGMLDAFPQSYKDAFRQICIENNQEFGLADKLSALIVGNKLRLIVNLYYSHEHLPADDEPILSVLGRLAIQHYENSPETNDNYPVVLESLSDRERQVCIGILSGKKAERIAADMEVAPSTVVTYRRRAYEKLGISSRASLFEVCNG